MLDFIVMQMSKVNRETVTIYKLDKYKHICLFVVKGYCLASTLDYTVMQVRKITMKRAIKKSFQKWA